MELRFLSFISCSFFRSGFLAHDAVLPDHHQREGVPAGGQPLVPEQPALPRCVELVDGVLRKHAKLKCAAFRKIACLDKREMEETAYTSFFSLILCARLSRTPSLSGTLETYLHLEAG